MSGQCSVESVQFLSQSCHSVRNLKSLVQSRRDNLDINFVFFIRNF